jgi:hypothetical protein
MSDLIFMAMIWVSGFVIGFGVSMTEYWRAFVRDHANRRGLL